MSSLRAEGAPTRSPLGPALPSALVLLVAALAVGLGAGAPGWSKSVLHRLPVRGRVVALTIDDGPDPHWTPATLATLRWAGARATFFLIGHNALAHPGLVRAEVSAGDELGDHTFSHPDLRRLTDPAIAAELERSAAAITRAGTPLRLYFRPPRGLLDARIVAVARSLGFRTVLWSVSVERYVDHEPLTRAVAALLARIRPGAIILAHDGGPPDRRRTIEALPLLLAGLRERGYRVVDLTELLAAARVPAPSYAGPVEAATGGLSPLPCVSADRRSCGSDAWRFGRPVLAARSPTTAPW